MEAYAVIQTGGKQYRVEAGQTIEIERLADEAGQEVQLATVLAHLAVEGDRQAGALGRVDQRCIAGAGVGDAEVVGEVEPLQPIGRQGDERLAEIATEEALEHNLRRRGCSCIIIAHRLSTVRDCDRILVLDEGQLVEQWSHKELMALRSGLYRGLVEQG